MAYHPKTPAGVADNTCGFVGGQWDDGSSPDRGGEQGDWDGDLSPMCSADEFMDNSLPIARPGLSDHFKNPAYIRAGHNDVTMHVPWDESGPSPKPAAGFPAMGISADAGGSGDTLISPHPMPDLRFHNGGISNDNGVLKR